MLRFPIPLKRGWGIVLAGIAANVFSRVLQHQVSETGYVGPPADFTWARDPCHRTRS